MCRPVWCPSGHHCPEGLTCMLVFAIFSAVLGMFQFGYNTGVINAPQKILEDFIANVYKTRTSKYMTEEMLALLWSVTVSVFAVGGMIGGISGGAIANYCGRKCGLLLNNAIAILGATLMSSSQLFRSIECLVMGRFFIGLSCGLNTALVPMYLSEIAPMTLRGALGTVSQLGVTIGLLLSQILGLPIILGTRDGWPFLLGVAFIPAILQLLLLPLCPESPRYLLISKGRITEARYALQRLRCSSDVEDDIEEMRIEDRAQQQEARITMLQLITNRSLQTPLIIGIIMQLSQQLSGINAIFYYSTNIFTSAGLSEEQAKYSTIGVGVVMVAMTLVSIMLMDRTGRRTLHLYGLGGMFITSMFLTIFLLFGFLYKWMSYMSVFSTLVYVVFFAIGPGSIPWMITAELFSQGPRPAAMSIAVLVNWFTNFMVGLAFPLMTAYNENAIEKYSFLPFTIFLAIFWIFTYWKVPETKNRTFEEISALFRKDDFITIDDVQYSHKSSSGDMFSHKSSSGDMIFDDKTLESCYLHHHHHCHYGDSSDAIIPHTTPPPPIAHTSRKKVTVAALNDHEFTPNHVIIEDQL
ncbi:glucose transporter type 1-like isoform X1 [Oppia nitens]|uniref:glucose transporter type 1-like isoform X1 n=1 Tax=Oppia nitens TaxID=1686743 RepID=UPI0023DBDC8F|nr:glucose transporter type 1-like isoform X1 [Oppia nitens]